MSEIYPERVQAAAPLTGHVPVSFAPEVVRAVQALAASEGMTVSAWIRREVEREVSRRASPGQPPATAPGRAAAPAAGQALNRVRDLARAWATLQASPGGDAGEVPARAGRTLLDVIHFNWASSAEEILRLVTRIAEDWLSPGADLFCPAAGQEVLDVIKGDAASGPHGAKPSWLLPWELLDDGQREVDMRIGETVAQAATAAAPTPGQAAYEVPWYALGLQGADPETEIADLRRRIHHVGAALCGENEGVRLWMLDCGNLVDKHRKDAEQFRRELADAQAEIRQLREQLCSALAETRQLRELLDEIGVMAANAPEDGDSFGLLEEIAMRIAEPAGLRAEAGPCEPGSVDIGEGTVWEDVKAAPELAAAMAETRQLRDLAAEILAAFGPSGSGHTARVGQVQIRRWRERAGLEG